MIHPNKITSNEIFIHGDFPNKLLTNSAGNTLGITDFLTTQSSQDTWHLYPSKIDTHHYSLNYMSCDSMAALPECILQNNHPLSLLWLYMNHTIVLSITQKPIQTTKWKHDQKESTIFVFNFKLSTIHRVNKKLRQTYWYQQKKPPSFIRECQTYRQLTIWWLSI